MIRILILLLLSACQQNKQGPIAIRWDREICTRCAMTISDRHYAAQIRSPSGQYYKFDDIGCALLWLDKQDWREQAQIWVKAYDADQWLDARKAHYVTGQISPMGYGLGATSKKTGLNFAQAQQKIMAIESNEHRHRGQHE